MKSEIARFLERDANPLFVSIEDFTKLTATWPSSSEYYFAPPGDEIFFNSLHKGITAEEFDTAVQFWDLHSAFCAYLLLVGWKTAQLSSSLKAAFSEWNLLSSASLARTLLETASAFTVESRKIIDTWKKCVEDGVSKQTVFDIRSILVPLIIQILIGTKRKDYLSGKRSKHLERTNILTLIASASKVTGKLDLRDLYEKLCDAVHPSWGSNDCFVFDMGISDTGRIRTKIHKSAAGRSELPHLILTTSLWSMSQLN
jgi:hypothetical protein